MKIVYKVVPVVSRTDKENAAQLMLLKSSLDLKPVEVMFQREEVHRDGMPCERVTFYHTRRSLEQIRELLLSTEEMREFVVGVAFEAQACQKTLFDDLEEDM